LERWKVPKVLAISIALVFAVIVIIGIGYFLVSQITNFTDEMPALKTKSTELFNTLQKWLSHELGVNLKKQQQLLTEVEADMKPWIGTALGSMAETLGMIFLMPVYT